LKFHKELELLGYIKISQIDDTLVYEYKPYIKKIIKVSYGPKGNIHTFQIYFELKRVPNFFSSSNKLCTAILVETLKVGLICILVL
jgi:hypothetical protein